MESPKHYLNFNKFILRTSLFPLDFIKKLTQNEDTSNAEIISLCKNPIISEAIYIASPPLFYEMQKWLKGEIENGKKSEKKIAKLKASLMRYFLRMSTRCTPFGLFAGFNTGSWDEQTNIQLLPQSQNISHTRLDMNYLCALAQDISKSEYVKEKLRFFPNSSIYTIGKQLRYVEYHYVNSKRIHHIAAVDNSEYLQQVLGKAKNGTLIKELTELLVDDDISFEEAGDFINELIDSQLLVSELEPSVTGNEFINQILNVLEGLKTNTYIKNIIDILQQTKISLEKVDTNPIGMPVVVYEQIAKQLKQLDTQYELKFLFQTDMVKPTKNNNLSQDILNDLFVAFEMLNKLSPKNLENNLSKFRESFYERYEEAEVPLLHALDTETGVGYLQNTTGDISPLVDDLALPGNQNQSYEIKWNNINTLLHKKYIEAIADNLKIIEITDKDLKGLEANWDDLPATISAMIQLVKNPEKEKPELYIKSVGGSSAANLIGRFCHADKEINNLVNKIIEKDEAQNKETILAEIAHLPESRIGNILHRPTFRKYEIPYLAKSSVPNKYQLSLDDLCISVRGNQIFLRSKRLNKLIIPRLTSAHNYSFNALPVYQFLCDMQMQNLRGGLGFSWGPLEKQHRFLPRVIYKNIILSRASWNFQINDLEPIYKLKDKKRQIEAFQSFAKKHQLHNEVILADSDNELYLNLKNTMCVKILLDQVKKRLSFTLKEFLFNRKNLIVNSPEGGFTNEFVVSFYKNLNKSKKISD